MILYFSKTKIPRDRPKGLKYFFLFKFCVHKFSRSFLVSNFPILSVYYFKVNFLSVTVIVVLEST